MPGRGVEIPSECVDLRGKRMRLFNPAVRRGRVMREPDLLSQDEMRRIIKAVNPPPTRRASIWAAACLVGVACAFSLIVFYTAGATIPLWGCILLGCFPPFGMIALAGLLRLAATNLWGVAAFTGPAYRVVDTLLKEGRCPSCAYPLRGNRPEADGATLCTECGGAWRIGAAP